MAFRNSTVKLNMGKIRSLNKAAVRALEQTAEELHTEVVQAQVMPRDTGAMQNESTFVDDSQSQYGKVSLVTTTPYVRRLYYHPEYNFHQEKWVDDNGKEHEGNANARGKWLEPWMEKGIHKDFCRKKFAELYRRNAGL